MQFTWVAFWKNGEWVAGLNDRSLVSYGVSLKAAVVSLRLLVRPADREWSHLSRSPHPGCDLRGDERSFTDAYWLVDDGGNRYETAPDKATRYAGTFDEFQILTGAWYACSDDSRQAVLSELLTLATDMMGGPNEKMAIAAYRLVAVMQNLPNYDDK